MIHRKVIFGQAYSRETSQSRENLNVILIANHWFPIELCFFVISVYYFWYCLIVSAHNVQLDLNTINPAWQKKSSSKYYYNWLRSHHRQFSLSLSVYTEIFQNKVVLGHIELRDTNKYLIVLPFFYLVILCIAQ